MTFLPGKAAATMRVPFFGIGIEPANVLFRTAEHHAHGRTG